MFIATEQNVHNFAILFAVWMFTCKGLQHKTILTYLCGLQFHLSSSIHSPFSVWHPKLYRILKGLFRDQCAEMPIFNRIKLPFSRALILIAQTKVLSSSLFHEALHASLCFGFMFLLRKSEFLTDNMGRSKIIEKKQICIKAKNVTFWFGEKSIRSSEKLPCQIYPDFISIFIEVSKADQYAKGATRFFPSDPNNSHCVVKWVYLYACRAHLHHDDPFFWSSNQILSRVDDKSVAIIMKLTAMAAGLPANRVSLHSLRVGGLVALFAANVPSHLKQLAGRWASEKSFILYARATMEQFSHIASALNNPFVVSADHIRMLYLRN